MVERYRSLPFATYDLAVYLPGGAVGLLVLKYFISIYIPGFDGFAVLPRSSDTVDQILRAVAWLSASYLLGHIAAFASSYAVEKFVHNALGYPSAVWLEVEKIAERGRDPTNAELKSLFNANVRAYPRDNFAGWIILLAQGPSIVLYIPMLWLRVYGYYTPKLPHGLVQPLRDALLDIGINIPVEPGTRWEKMVEHYVANNCPIAYTRMYNYLVIYGSLRIISFIILCIIWFLTIGNLLTQVNDLSFDFNFFLFYWCLVIIYVVGVMAFAKFNRRYFEECVLAFLMHRISTGKPLVD